MDLLIHDPPPKPRKIVVKDGESATRPSHKNDDLDLKRKLYPEPKGL